MDLTNDYPWFQLHWKLRNLLATACPAHHCASSQLSTRPRARLSHLKTASALACSSQGGFATTH